MDRQLGLDEKTFLKSNAIIAQLLDKGQELSRKEIAAELEKKGIPMNHLKAAHFLFRAELDMVVCNGSRREKESTYALFDSKVPAGKLPEPEEALAKLAHRYYNSHGPATIRDFSWWSGLPVAAAKKGTELAASKLKNRQIDDETYWFSKTSSPEIPTIPTFHMLPAFDEFLVGYKNRSASLEAEYTKKTITNNGLFRPVIVQHGKVLGTWKRSIKKDTVHIEPVFFNANNRLSKKELMETASLYGQFSGKNVRIIE
jgi:hypothetical protein